jgi:cytochrome c-type biogenesis protein CcmH/NrfF
MTPKINISENTQKILLWGSVALLVGITFVVIKNKKDKKIRLANEEEGIQKEYENILNRIDKTPK